MYMLAEVNRVLKPGGTLIMTTPNVVSSWGITKMLRGIEPYFYMQYHTSGNLYRHNYEYSIHSLMKLVKAAGFDGSIWTEDTFEDPNHADMDRLKGAGYNITHIGDNIFTVAKKVGPVIDRMPMGIYTTD
jgi:ubiquinone/menaquinone biosynthesis C-methylase UbiE